MQPPIVSVLARSLLAGELLVDEAASSAERTLGRPWRWIRPLASRFVDAFAGETRPRHRDVVRFLDEDAAFQRALSRHSKSLSIEHWLAEPQRMRPVEAAAGWDLPVIESAGDLADWFGVLPGELDWFADLKGLTYKNRSPRLRHYHYRILAKRAGGVRLIEIPKPHLKGMQRRILAAILNRIPVHPAVHGFVRGRSIKTFIAPHTGRRVVLRMDLQDFFPSFGAARIQALFRTFGYPESVADLLGGICTNAVPRDSWHQPSVHIEPADLVEARAFYSRPHLPQGAPTSPALANLCTYRVDCRLAGLAKSAGAEYTRYADDLAFSGDDAFDRCIERFSIHAAAILLEEGFTVNHRKTRIMRQSVRQHLAGLVANERANIRRTDFDRLKAILTNCMRSGPASQNRDAHPHFRWHLEGRVAFVESIHPGKGQRLRSIFERIQWP